mgnify:CR=1 FL=1
MNDPLIVEIVTHDTANGIAHIKYTHPSDSSKVHEDHYELIHVIPGTWKILQDQNLTFTTEMQANVINTLVGWQQQLHANNAFHFQHGNKPNDFHERKFVKVGK